MCQSTDITLRAEVRNVCHCQGRKLKSRREDHQRTEQRTNTERSHSQMVIVPHSNGKKKIPLHLIRTYAQIPHSHGRLMEVWSLAGWMYHEYFRASLLILLPRSCSPASGFPRAARFQLWQQLKCFAWASYALQPWLKITLGLKP